MVKFKFHPEKKSISEKSLNFDRKYSGYIGNKYCMYFNYNIISQKLPKFSYIFVKSLIKFCKKNNGMPTVNKIIQLNLKN